MKRNADIGLFTNPSSMGIEQHEKKMVVAGMADDNVGGCRSGAGARHVSGHRYPSGR
ncbi:hypothetical protein DESC_700178 [Desulfosarcina cetonica]|nr:hypothetical protein DESC_700178 [Desulfosarcina cetonica]